MGRRTFSQEFKLEAVRAVRERGLPVAQIARELDIHENLLRKWVRTEEGRPSVRSSSKAQPSEADVAKLQRELKKVTMSAHIQPVYRERPFRGDGSKENMLFVSTNMLCIPKEMDVPRNQAHAMRSYASREQGLKANWAKAI